MFLCLSGLTRDLHRCLSDSSFTFTCFRVHLALLAVLGLATGVYGVHYNLTTVDIVVFVPVGYLRTVDVFVNDSSLVDFDVSAKPADTEAHMFGKKSRTTGLSGFTPAVKSQWLLYGGRLYSYITLYYTRYIIVNSMYYIWFIACIALCIMYYR